MKLLAFSGKKGSGKTTLAAFLPRNGAELFPAGHTRARVSLFAFADPIKDFCRDYLGLDPACLRGTDEQKNTPTRFSWGQLPDQDLVNDTLWPRCQSTTSLLNTKRLFVTHREMMQYWGSCLRKQDPDVWVRRCLDSIVTAGCDVAAIQDLRFPNELKAVRALGGKVVRLTRNPHPGDTHASETALDREHYPAQEFDAVLDNATMNRVEQEKELVTVLRQWGWVR